MNDTNKKIDPGDIASFEHRSFFVDPKKWSLLDEHAEKAGVTAEELLRDILNWALDDMQIKN